MKIYNTVTFENKTHMFADNIEVPEEGLFEATLVDQNNVRCWMLFRSGVIAELKELD